MTVVALMFAALGSGMSTPARGAAPSERSWMRVVCQTGLHEERNELDDARLRVELARKALAAYEEIFGQIASLWEQQAVERMIFLRARYDRDAARLSLERADLELARQEALIEQYALACGEAGRDLSNEERARALDRAAESYLRIDCEAQAKAIEVAEVNLAFDREWLASIRDLREADVATRQDEILAELELAQEEARLAEARRRTASCRSTDAADDGSARR